MGLDGTLSVVSRPTVQLTAPRNIPSEPVLAILALDIMSPVPMTTIRPPGTLKGRLPRTATFSEATATPSLFGGSIWGRLLMSTPGVNGWIPRWRESIAPQAVGDVGARVTTVRPASAGRPVSGRTLRA